MFQTRHNPWCIKLYHLQLFSNTTRKYTNTYPLTQSHPHSQQSRSSPSVSPSPTPFPSPNPTTTPSPPSPTQSHPQSQPYLDFLQLVIHVDNVVELVQEPVVNVGQLVELLNGVAGLEGSSQDEHPLVSRVDQHLEGSTRKCYEWSDARKF